MAPRAQWKGYLKLSLVSCPVALFSAASTSERISFHLINRATDNRLKQQYIDSVTGDLVEPEDRIRGYEIGKGHYIPLEPEEIKDVQIESTHTIDIDQFVPVTEIDPVYLESRYYIAPDDKVAEEPFSVIREAMLKRDMAGLARVVLYGRERILMLQARDKGITATMAKRERGGRIFIGYLRNTRCATAVAAYSTRARKDAGISTPLDWSELKTSLSAAQFTLLNIETRLTHLKRDPWAQMVKLRQALPASSHWP